MCVRYIKSILIEIVVFEHCGMVLVTMKMIGLGEVWIFTGIEIKTCSLWKNVSS